MNDYVKPRVNPRQGTSCAMLKNTLRKRLLKQLNKVSKEEMARVSKDICIKLANLPPLIDTLHIATYASIGNEINLDEFTASARKQGINIYYPRFNTTNANYELILIRNWHDKFVKGYLGIPEPKSNNEVLNNSIRENKLSWLIPGIAFDKKGHRLGRGKGHYDRLLSGTEGTKIGIAYEWQIIDNVPVEVTDVAMDYILTRNNLLKCHI